VLGSVSSSPWTWGANLNADVLLTVDRPINVTRVRQCKADWSPNPQPCLALSLTRELRGRQTAFCCAGLWLSSRIEVPGSGTVVIDWSPEARNQVPIPAGVTVNLGSLNLLAATQGDFDNDAVFALIEGVDGQGTPVSIQSSIFTPSDHFQNYLELCRSVGSSPSR